MNRLPRVLTKGGVKYYSDMFRFKKGGRNTPFMQSIDDVRFYVRLDNQDPTAALWAKARLHALNHNCHTVMRELSAQEHLYASK